MNHKIKYFLSSLTLVFIALIWGLVSFPDSKLHVIFCDVGQGDATLIILGQTQILIDGGPNDKVLACLANHLPYWDRTIEMIVLTHPESDHITGLVSVIQRYGVRQILANSLVTDTGVFSKFREEVIAKKIPVYSPKYGDKIKISKLTLDILFPEEKQGNEIVFQSPQDLKVLGISAFTGNFNETAIVSELEYGSFKALFTADSGIDQEKLMADNSELELVDVLKVAHHGSKYSTSTELLDLIQPKLAVISVGASNTYGHPTSEVLDRLQAIGAKIRRTDINGEVEVVSDGKSWGIK